MSEQHIHEPLMDMFIFETTQLLEQLEQAILNSESISTYTETSINEIFRIMHTIKGSSAMMMLNDISLLAHAIEDLFYYLRDIKPNNIDTSTISDLVLDGVDFIKVEVKKLENGNTVDGASSSIISNINEYLSMIKQSNITEPMNKVFEAVIFFQEGCEMENIRAYTIIRNLNGFAKKISCIPKDIMDNDESVEIIRKDGLKLYFESDYTYAKLNEFFMQTIFLKDMELNQLENDVVYMQQMEDSEATEFEDIISERDKNNNLLNVKKDKDKNKDKDKDKDKDEEKDKTNGSTAQSIISVNVAKLDQLMDLVGEMVIAEAMVIQNPDLVGLELDNFRKAARQLNKITTEMQNTVMSIRMVPLSTTFNKMNRIVRDMCKKLEKEVRLKIIGEDTEVDKNIIEHISDPLMHLVRNSIDHGIESSEERGENGKTKVGTVTLTARNSGSDVLIIVSDDGGGLDRDKILSKASQQNLLIKREEDMSDREVYNLIILPGFSTNDNVTEFSGRGVGMDVVARNIEAVGGTVYVDSMPGKGTEITLKIPLTLAIIDGMNIKVGNSRYTIPIISIKESFRPSKKDIISDPDGNEMILVRGQCYKILRIHEVYKVKTQITELYNGIIIMIEHGDKTICIFADELIGQQQVVVKALPEYIQTFKTIRGLAGCTLLGDGSISLILDVAGMINM
ncbi:MAG: cheA2 [Clostridiales bacterium]|jgi:two-component system chemotaxis sensor kinase CheA|nr:cheA2 [Clostridiales bacterium]